MVEMKFLAKHGRDGLIEGGFGISISGATEGAEEFAIGDHASVGVDVEISTAGGDDERSGGFFDRMQSRGAENVVKENGDGKRADTADLRGDGSKVVASKDSWIEVADEFATLRGGASINNHGSGFDHL